MCDHGKGCGADIIFYSGAPNKLSISYPRPKIGNTVFTKIRGECLTQKCDFLVTPKKVPISANTGPILDFRHDIESDGLSFLCQI